MYADDGDDDGDDNDDDDDYLFSAGPSNSHIKCLCVMSDSCLDWPN